MNDDLRTLTMVLDAVEHATKAVPDRVTRSVLEGAVKRGRVALGRIGEPAALDDAKRDAERVAGRRGGR